jgi:hypothetical protein
MKKIQKIEKNNILLKKYRNIEKSELNRKPYLKIHIKNSINNSLNSQIKNILIIEILLKNLFFSFFYFKYLKTKKIFCYYFYF